MKKYFIIFGIIISSFFFSSSMVSATEYNITIPNNIQDFVENKLSGMKSLADTAIQQQHNGYYYKYYTIMCRTDNLNCWVYMWLQNTSITPINNFGNFKLGFYQIGYTMCYNNGYTYLTDCGTASAGPYQQVYQTRFFLYCSETCPSHNITDLNGDIYHFTYGNYTYTMSGNDTFFPFVYDIYQASLQPPPEPTLLDDFVSLVLEKLVAITEFISSNDIYLAIFVIFILYFVILLFRRLK